MSILNVIASVIGVLIGAIVVPFVFKKAAAQWFQRDKHYFLRKENSMCQICFVKKTAYSCNLKTCSYSVVLDVIKLLQKAVDSIDLASPCIQVSEISTALIEAARRGVLVRIVYGDIRGEGGPPRATLKCMAAGIRLKARDTHGIMMHNKFIVIDGKVLIRSSLNWTYQCLQGNYENLQMLSDPQMVTWYQEYFEMMWCDEHNIHPSHAVKERIIRNQAFLEEQRIVSFSPPAAKNI